MSKVLECEFHLLSTPTFFNPNRIKVQQLLYYAQAWSLATYGTPVFEQEFQFSDSGPTIPQSREILNNLRSISISLLPEEKWVLDLVVDNYGPFASEELEQLIRHEIPWQNAQRHRFKELSFRHSMFLDDMKCYYPHFADLDEEGRISGIKTNATMSKKSTGEELFSLKKSEGGKLRWMTLDKLQEYVQKNPLSEMKSVRRPAFFKS